ncbi:hypothetical protein [Clostridium sp. CCUG 7971]|uniref:hypothetical protein n=1 Tax=Clostridium sp. CCUG 7971 TaxID=2811414 RepID=UPI001ABB8C4C|nr:hypothetical protein [Clostridium sp. CCUG 7971]MBO3444598.1 hypothetical protein [Clostridium sp. CCUG 7971]
MKINIKKLSNYLMNTGILLSLYSLYVVYYSRKSMPPGTCPIDENNNLLYVSIIISALGFITSFIQSKEE